MESVHDLVRSEPSQAISVGSPVSGRSGGDTPIVVKIYARGRGVSLVGQGSDLPGREGTFELEAHGKVFVFDVAGAVEANGLVTPVEGDVTAIFLSIQTVDQEHLTKFGNGIGHDGSPLKTTILNLPQGYGKTSIGQQLADKLGCSAVVDDWTASDPLTPGALHLTCCDIDNQRATPPQSVALGTIPSIQPGEYYAGIILNHEGTPTHHLVLMADRLTGELKWQDAMDWAATIRGSLPTRQEQSLLFSNCKQHIKPDWYWSCEENSASYAWDCYFDDGIQISSLKGDEDCAVAVRRFPIDPLTGGAA